MWLYKFVYFYGRISILASNGAIESLTLRPLYMKTDVTWDLIIILLCTECGRGRDHISRYYIFTTFFDTINVYSLCQLILNQNFAQVTMLTISIAIFLFATPKLIIKLKFFSYRLAGTQGKHFKFINNSPGISVCLNSVPKGLLYISVQLTIFAPTGRSHYLHKTKSEEILSFLQRTILFDGLVRSLNTKWPQDT